VSLEKREDLHPAAVAALAERGGVLEQSATEPVAEGETGDLRDAAAGLEEHAGHAFIAQAPARETAAAGEDARGQRGIVHDLRDPGRADEREIVVLPWGPVRARALGDDGADEPRARALHLHAPRRGARLLHARHALGRGDRAAGDANKHLGPLRAVMRAAEEWGYV
jgi:hypothetical protein